jgi:hypothetical protein
MMTMMISGNPGYETWKLICQRRILWCRVQITLHIGLQHILVLFPPLPHPGWAYLKFGQTSSFHILPVHLIIFPYFSVGLKNNFLSVLILVSWLKNVIKPICQVWPKSVSHSDEKCVYNCNTDYRSFDMEHIFLTNSCSCSAIGSHAHFLPLVQSDPTSPGGSYWLARAQASRLIAL